MAEERGDGFEAHASVDGLGGEGVAELVGVDCSEAGSGGGGGDDAVNGSAVQWCVAVCHEPAGGADVVDVGGGPVGEELNKVGVQGDEPVVAEFADGDSEPVGVTDLGDRVSGEVTQFAGS